MPFSPVADCVLVFLRKMLTSFQLDFVALKGIVGSAGFMSLYISSELSSCLRSFVAFNSPDLLSPKSLDRHLNRFFIKSTLSFIRCFLSLWWHSSQHKILMRSLRLFLRSPLRAVISFRSLFYLGWLFILAFCSFLLKRSVPKLQIIEDIVLSFFPSSPAIAAFSTWSASRSNISHSFLVAVAVHSDFRAFLGHDGYPQ